MRLPLALVHAVGAGPLALAVLGSDAEAWALPLTSALELTVSLAVPELLPVVTCEAVTPAVEVVLLHSEAV